MPAAGSTNLPTAEAEEEDEIDDDMLNRLAGLRAWSRDLFKQPEPFQTSILGPVCLFFSSICFKSFSVFTDYTVLLETIIVQAIFSITFWLKCFRMTDGRKVDLGFIYKMLDTRYDFKGSDPRV